MRCSRSPSLLNVGVSRTVDMKLSEFQCVTCLFFLSPGSLLLVSTPQVWFRTSINIHTLPHLCRCALSLLMCRLPLSFVAEYVLKGRGNKRFTAQFVFPAPSCRSLLLSQLLLISRLVLSWVNSSPGSYLLQLWTWQRTPTLSLLVRQVDFQQALGAFIITSPSSCYLSTLPMEVHVLSPQPQWTGPCVKVSVCFNLLLHCTASSIVPFIFSLPQDHNNPTAFVRNTECAEDCVLCAQCTNGISLEN